MRAVLLLALALAACTGVTVRPDLDCRDTTYDMAQPAPETWGEAAADLLADCIPMIRATVKL